MNLILKIFTSVSILSMKQISVNNLSQTKRAQLLNSASFPAYYLFISSYQVDEELGVAFYSLDFGVLANHTVYEWTITTRYSEIRRVKDEFAQAVPEGNRMLFPGKKIFGRLKKHFQAKRIEQLNDWLGQLNKFTQVASLPTFVQLLGVREKNLRWNNL